MLKANKRANKEVFDILIDQTSQLVSKSALDVFWIDESKQKGTDFASRFTHAFEQIFALGYENIISIGNDSPGLEITHLECALQNLNNGKAVIGPSGDGGAYLIGLNRSQFHAGTFKNLPWQEEQLQTQLACSISAGNQSIHYLAELEDLDTIKDFLNYSIQNPHSLLGLICKSLIDQERARFLTSCPCIPKPVHFSTGPLRAPPFHSAA